MQSLAPDLLTAFGMTALAGWTAAGVMWALGRQYWRQGMSQAVLSTALFGCAYVFFALQSVMETLAMQVTSKLLVSASIAVFTLGLQRFRQSTDIVRDTLTLALPLLGSALMALIFLPGDLSAFNRFQTIITALQTGYAMALLMRMRESTPGPGWVLVIGATCVQLLSAIALVFVQDRPSPDFHSSAPVAAVLALWGSCLVMYLKMMVASIGFLIMLRDRQSALTRHRKWFDPLTQLPNRALLAHTLRKTLDSAARAGKPVSVVVLDIDHFHSFNRQHGHLAGDQVIQLVGHVLKKQSRGKDFVARWGGEEFVVVLPNAMLHEAEVMAQRVLGAIRSTPLTLRNGAQLRVTVSVGVHSRTPSPGMDWRTLVTAASEAMETAKHKGRDRVQLSSPSQAPT